MALFMAILATIVGLLTTLYVFIYNAGDVDDKNFEKNLKISLAKAIATVTIMYVVANCVTGQVTAKYRKEKRTRHLPKPQHHMASRVTPSILLILAIVLLVLSVVQQREVATSTSTIQAAGHQLRVYRLASQPTEKVISSRFQCLI